MNLPVDDDAPPARREAGFDPGGITRPDRRLLTYYAVVSLLVTVGILPVSLIVFLPLYFKYRTLRYRFEDEAISLSWGVLFRREVYLTHRRIQDIHVTRNVIQRWMGLATVAIQTASGSSAPEMKIEGVLEAAALRDYLYSKMRGAREEDAADAESTATAGREALALLEEIRDAIDRIADGSRRGPA